jgi:hypothetical protein
MRSLEKAALSTVCLLLASACGGATASGPLDGGKADSAIVNPGHDAASRGDAAKGSDARVDAGAPGLPPANDGGPTNDAGAGVCPASYSVAAQGGHCTDTSARCEYDRGTCFCTTSPRGLPMGVPIGSDAGITPVWSCSQLAPGCPPAPPTLGSACTTDGTTCDYGMCMGGRSIECTGGKWGMGFGACPG